MDPSAVLWWRQLHWHLGVNQLCTSLILSVYLSLFSFVLDFAGLFFCCCCWWLFFVCFSFGLEHLLHFSYFPVFITVRPVSFSSLGFLILLLQVLLFLKFFNCFVI